MSGRDYQTISLEPVDEHVLQVVLSRPAVMNALNTRMMTELRDCFQQLYVDQQNLRVVLLRGAGDRAFCAGGDLKERQGMSDTTWRRQHAILEQMVDAVMACPIPLIAAVTGSCFGGGLELALAADFIVASDNSRFGFPEGRLGIMPGACGTQNLARACGQRRAKEIMLTGLPFNAGQALQWGIANHSWPADQFEARLQQMASSICETAPISGRQIKKSIDIAAQADFSTGYAFEIEAYNRTVPTRDRHEGVNAFNEKRKPVFTGE